ncbi:MAG: DNA polymerase III subunit beta [Bacteroidetes bacterium]|nr:MAG: DNA polymerase III subunit beta [Bacteroidota bacterium]
MKFSASSSQLLKHLQIAGGAISSNPVLPILEDYLIEIGQNQITITASDLETSIITTMEANTEGSGKAAVPAKILMDTLKALPEQPVTIEIDEETRGVRITSSYGTYKMVGENGEDFPDLPSEEDDGLDSVSLNSEDLADAIGKTLFATSNDELRPNMNGVYFQIDFGKITFVATDAHKLVRYILDGLDSEVSTSFIVPKKALNLMKNALPGEGKLSLAFNNSNAFFQFNETRLICRLIDARFPDYNAVIPTENPNTLTVGRNDLLNSLRRIIIYSNKTTHQVKFNIEAEELVISAQDLDFSNEATERLPCQYSGEQLAISFNAKFLIEMLGVLDCEEVRFEMSSPNRAGILVPAEQEEGKDLLMLLMPVIVSH